jgi:putative ABC transport system permease protein
VLLGTVVTMGYATIQGWPAVLPPWAPAGALAATLLIGALAGPCPAIRAARMSPAETLANP